MPALNFTILTESVKDGSKTQTIRTPRKRPIKPGDRLIFYKGLRTRYCEKIGEGACTEVVRCEIHPDHVILIEPEESRGIWGSWELEQFAKADGFEDWEECKAWFFRKGQPIPFVGDIIKWSLN